VIVGFGGVDCDSGVTRVYHFKGLRNSRVRIRKE
jgi:hypothetical protein